MSKQTAQILTRIPLTEARKGLGNLAKRAHLNSEVFVLENDGIPLAALIDIDEYEDYLDAHDPKVQADLKASHADYLAGRTAPLSDLIAELKKKRKKAR